MKEHKIKIVKAIPFGKGLDRCYMPPLGMARIYTYLINQGYNITQHDIYKKFNFFTLYFYKILRFFVVRFFNSEKEFIDFLKSSRFSFILLFVKYYISSKCFKKIDILLISAYDSCKYSSVFSIIIAKLFKQINPNGIVIIGGEWNHDAYIYDNLNTFLRIGVLDYYIHHDGEKGLDLLLRYINKENIDLKKIPGLCYMENKTLVINTEDYLEKPIRVSFEGLNLKEYSWQESGFFNKISKTKFPLESVTMLPVYSTTGCIYKCAFCGNSETSCRALSPKESVDNIQYLSNVYKTKYFFFMDSTINISLKYIKEFCDEILKRDLKIYWTSCASFRGVENKEIFGLMRRAGACRLIYGLETASPRLLNFINKDIKLSVVEKGIKWSHEAGIWTDLEIIAGLPSETEDDLNHTINFLNRNSEYIDNVWLNRFFLVKGSRMHKFPEKYNIKNIKFSDKLVSSDKFFEFPYRYFYDEINGHLWEQKLKQIEESHKAIQSCMIKNELNVNYDYQMTNVLLYLYSFLGSKKEIKKYYKNYEQNFINRRY